MRAVEKRVLRKSPFWPLVVPRNAPSSTGFGPLLSLVSLHSGYYYKISAQEYCTLEAIDTLHASAYYRGEFAHHSEIFEGLRMPKHQAIRPSTPLLHVMLLCRAKTWIRAPTIVSTRRNTGRISVTKAMIGKSSALMIKISGTERDFDRRGFHPFPDPPPSG